MIHTTDLMLGNWVEFATGLHNDKRSIPMQVTAIFSDTVYLDFEGNEGDAFEEEETNLLGIPITEDVLNKASFKRVRVINGKEYYYYLDGQEIYSTNRLSLIVENGVGVLYRPYNGSHILGFIYLHQLQNAYFMLTGKRLEVKL